MAVTPFEAEQGSRRAILPMVLLNSFAVPMMLSATNVALPAISDDLNLNALMLSWVPMTFLMASAMAVLVFGRLADMYGRKKIFLTGTFALIATSLLVASAQNGWMLLIARFLQGVSGAMLFATSMAILTSAFPPEVRGGVIGWAVGAIYVGLSCGPLIGGYVVEYLGWRAAFLAHMPLGLIVAYLGLCHVKGDWWEEEHQVFDVSGALLYALAIALLCFGVSLLPGLWGGVLVVMGVATMVSFMVTARRKTNPIWHVELFFTQRLFTYSCMASFIMYTATYANVVLMSLYLQYLKGMPASSAGWVMMVQPAAMAVFSPVFGRLSDRVQPRYLASAGMVLTAGGLGGLSQLTADSPAAWYVASLLLTGLGFSLFSSPNTNAIMSSVPRPHIGHAASAVATMRVLGQMASMVVVTLVMALVVGAVQIQPAQYPQLERAVQTCFTLAAGLCLLGCVLSYNRGELKH